MVKYSSQNPIITPEAVPPLGKNFRVIGSFNPGVTLFEGKPLLLVRVAERAESGERGTVHVPLADNGKIKLLSFDTSDERYDFSDVRTIRGKNRNYLTSMSLFMVATSEDGEHFTLHPERCLIPDGEYEKFGVEDPRITFIDGVYYITYSAISDCGICTVLARTSDFVNFEKMGNILHPDNKDAVLFPEKINGKYNMIHRPSTSAFAYPEMWIAESDNLTYWGNHRRIMTVRQSGWDSARIGVSSTPMRVEDGWLVLYHGADENDRYCLGAVLLDSERPDMVLARTVSPIMEPINAYEQKGFLSNVVFACGCIRSGDMLRVYYGAADKYVCLAEISVSQILKQLKEGK